MFYRYRHLSYLFINHLFIYWYTESIRAYFRKIKHPGIGYFMKRCSMKKNYFLTLNQKCQNNFQLGGTRLPPALLNYPSALLWNKYTPLLKRRALFHEQFDSNKHFLNFWYFSIERILSHISHMCFLMHKI